jgi:fructose-1,6-bisphosphatase
MLIISAGFIKVFSSKLSIKGVTRVFELFGKFLGQKEFKNY